MDELEHRYLRSAVEFAVMMAAEGQKKRRSPLKFPAVFKKYLRVQRIPAAGLGPIRRAIAADDDFRRKIAVGALPELVDPIGILWLQRPPDWEQSIRDLVATSIAEQAETDAATQIRREQKKREAAEQAAVRSRIEVLELQRLLGESVTEVDSLRADVAKLSESAAEMRTELLDARNEARHANDRSLAAAGKLEVAIAQRDAALAARTDAELVRDDALADRTTLSADVAELAALASTAQELADRLAVLNAPASDAPSHAPRRRPLAIPGGMLGGSLQVAEYLVRSGATVLVDGYNVSMLGWPDLSIGEQRRVLLDGAENLARRFGCDITVVFDGAEVVGAAADQRRLIRVVYSPEGVIADDIIRSEADRLPASRQVIVVTNDAEIIDDVRGMGANTVSSDRFVELLRH